MADNVTLNAGSGGSVVATDDIGGVHHQYVKLEFGPADTATKVENVSGSRVPVELGDDNPVTLQASVVSGVTNTTATKTTTTGLGKYNNVQILINITGGGAVTGLLQLFLQDSIDGGTTWNDLIASNTFVFGAAVITQVFSVAGRSGTTQTQGSALNVEALAAGTARQGPWGDRIRVREKVSGVSGTPTGVTYTITGVFKR